MKSGQGYKGYVIEARSCEFKDNGFSAEFSVEEHYADGVMETEFYLPRHIPHAGFRDGGGNSGWTTEDRYGFPERRSVVVNS